MSGYFCIAMLEDPPYNMFIAATENEPEKWRDELPLPSHLLCYEYFDDADEVERQCLQTLNAQGVPAKVSKAFSAAPYEVITAFLEARDNLNLALDSCEDSEVEINEDEADQLYELAQELDIHNPERFNLMSRAAGCGHMYALVEVAECFDYGWGCEKNFMQAFEAAKQAIDFLRDYDLNPDLGERLYDLADDLNDAQARFILLKKLADIGCIDALFGAARCYCDGRGISIDPKMALKLIGHTDLTALSASQRNALGKIYFDLANVYKEGIEKTIPDLKKSFKYYKQSADLGYWPAYQGVAWCYLDGDGVKKDLNEALDWALRLIDMGCGYGHVIATECYNEAGMKEEAENLWRQFFEKLLANTEKDDTEKAYTMSSYVEQVLSKKITPVHTKKETQHFSKYAEVLKKDDPNLYEETIRWFESH